MLRFLTPANNDDQRYMIYNHKNERTLVSKKGGGWGPNSIQFVYDENNHLIGEYDSAGVVKYEYVWLGDKPVAVIVGSGSSAKTYYIVTDTSNTPHRLIDATNEATVWAWDNTAFGVNAPSTETVTFNLRFPGQYYDANSKLHYNLNRYYSPELGRYLEPDSIGLEGGLNLYAYAGANPISYIDPEGTHTEEAYQRMDGYFDDRVGKKDACINYHRNGLEQLLGKKLTMTDTNAIQTTTDGSLGLREVMKKMGLASAPLAFGTFNSRIKSVANLKNLDGLGEFIQKRYTYRRTGSPNDLYDVYGVSIADGYHTLAISYTEAKPWYDGLLGIEAEPRSVFTLYDQNSQSTFDNPADLNKALLKKYPAADSRFSQYGGTTAIHKIFNP